MKKIMMILALTLSVNSFSYKIVSNEKSIIDRIFTSKNVNELVKGRFDEKTEIAAISDYKSSELQSYEDAKKGINAGIEKYAYEILSEELSIIGLTGPGFNEIKMREFAKDIAKNYDETNIIVAGKWKGDNSNQFYTLLKVEKAPIEVKAKTLFKERLNLVIERLMKLRDDIN